MCALNFKVCLPLILGYFLVIVQGFPEKSKLIAHEMTHTGVSPHKCEVCNKYFTTGSALKSHKHLHLGIRPHCCSICGKAYIKRWHLQQHMRKAHNTIEVAWQAIETQTCLSAAEQITIQQQTIEFQ